MPGVLHSSLSSFATVLSSKIASYRKKQSAYVSNNGTKRLSKAFFKLDKALPATGADTFYNIFIHEITVLVLLFTSYNSIGNLSIHSGKQM